MAKKQNAKGNGETQIARVKFYNCGKKGHYTRDYPEPKKVPFFTYSPELYVCSHALVAKSFPNWIVDTGASKHIVRDRAGFVDFHRFPVGSQTVVLGNGSEEDVLGVGTYRLTLKGGNKLLLFDALHAPGVRTCLLSLVSLMKSGFGFSSCSDGLNILYGGNVFGHATLRNDFLVLDLDECYNDSNSASVSHFDSDLESIK